MTTLADVIDALHQACDQAEGDYFQARDVLAAPQTRSALNRLRREDVATWCAYEDRLADIARGWGLPITPTEGPKR